MSRTRLGQKLRDGGGETLVEVMASIVIGTLSVALLFGAIMASARIDESARKMDGTYYQALSDAEAQAAPMPGDPGTAKLNYAADGVEMPPLPVTLYGGSGAVSYALSVGGGGP